MNDTSADQHTSAMAKLLEGVLRIMLTIEEECDQPLNMMRTELECDVGGSRRGYVVTIERNDSAMVDAGLN